MRTMPYNRAAGRISTHAMAGTKNEIDGSFREMVWLSRRRPLPERF